MCSQKMVALNADDYSCMFEEISDELKTEYPEVYLRSRRRT